MNEGIVQSGTGVGTAAAKSALNAPNRQLGDK